MDGGTERIREVVKDAAADDGVGRLRGGKTSERRQEMPHIHL